MVFMGILFVIPFSLMVIGSLRQTAIFIPDLGYLLASPTLANYQYVLGREQFPRWFVNSAILSVTPVITQSFLCLLLGFVFARKNFVGKSIIFWTMIAMIMIPTHLMVIPQYILFNRIGWINTYWAILVPDLWAIVGVFFARQYLQTIPLELDQAAYMDGASDWQVFVRVIAPLCGPVVATIGTLTFISNWNELFRPLIFMLSQDMYPLMVGLASLYSLEGNFGIQMASATLAFLPTFTLFLFFQRFFTRGIQLSGLD
jgi:multiple sugar transport system permease protein